MSDGVDSALALVVARLRHDVARLEAAGLDAAATREALDAAREARAAHAESAAYAEPKGLPS